MTRFLLILASLLVLLNAGLLLWPDETSYAPHVYAAKDDVNPHFLRLNKEIEARFYSRPVEEVVDTASGDEVVSSATDLDPAFEGCYRIGPFMHQANYELAQAVLFNAGVNYKKSKRASNASNVFRIYLGPFQTQPEVERARIELRSKKVLDHFVRKQADDSLVISLGIYSTTETASAALTLFEDKLEGVKQRSENVVLPDTYWLHFGLSEDDSALGQLSAIDWGEPSAKMGLFSCEV